jgi:chemotaxis signal transduction protein
MGDSRASPDKSAEPAALGPVAEQARCIAARIGDGLYGFRVDEVQEVIAMRHLSRAFHAPAGLLGVTTLRGDVLAVIDSRALLGEASPKADAAPNRGASAISDATGAARIVVVREAAGLRRRAGVLVDELCGLRELPEAGLSPPPSTLPEAVRDLVTGVIAAAPACAVLSVADMLDSPLLAFDR